MEYEGTDINRSLIVWITYIKNVTRLYNTCRMIAKKTNTLNLRVDPLVKDDVRYAANPKQRSVANMVEIMIRQYCQDAGYPVLEQTPLFGDEQ